jgi:dihydrodipicolinate synthase/N-acetylneuraminate lyase
MDNLLPERLHDLLRASVRGVYQHRRNIEREQRRIRDLYEAARAQGLRPATIKHVMSLLEMPEEALEQQQVRELERAAYWRIVEDMRFELGVKRLDDGDEGEG